MDYSEKNIPIPTHREYLKRLVEKIESVIRRMRWKALFFLNKDDQTEDTTSTSNDESEESDGEKNEYFGFKSKKAPRPVSELSDFEKDLINMVDNIQFQKADNPLQRKLKKDMDTINKSDKVFVQADKTRNVYKMDKNAYSKLLTENITQKYKPSSERTVDKINKEFASIAGKLNLNERIDSTTEKQAFITIKDHKSNFESNPKCRLINPTKSELGKVSKQFIGRINSNIRDKINVNQWTSTSQVLDWFDNIAEKENKTFLVFDVVDFYPSISEKLLKKTLTWAKQYTEIKTTEYDTIMHARKTLLYDQNHKPWVKKDTSNSFDVAMGAFDGAEVCEMVGLFMLQKLKTEITTANIGIYRDDGLAVLNTRSGRLTDQVRKQITKIFNSVDLKITVETNLKSVNFLDVNLNLETKVHKPYRKPNDCPMYVHADSNHPPNIIRNIPAAIERRISTLSSNNAVFKENSELYNDALKSCGYKETMRYKKDNRPRKRRKRTRKVLWFNPPYNKSVKTNVAGKFLKLIDRHFPKGNKLHKLFNRNNVKVSYSCMKNMSAVIKTHNQKITKSTNQKPTRNCNCKDKAKCPLKGNCLSKAVVYRATVKSDINEKSYVGLTGNAFKDRYNNHQFTFRHKSCRKSTELSKYVWNLKDKGINYVIQWEIMKHSNTNMRESGQCNLCLDEKMEILKLKGSAINKRSEIISTCRHRKKPLNYAKEKT